MECFVFIEFEISHSSLRIASAAFNINLLAWSNITYCLSYQLSRDRWFIINVNHRRYAVISSRLQIVPLYSVYISGATSSVPVGRREPLMSPCRQTKTRPESLLAGYVTPR